jgi:hypothetical protein
MSRNHQRLVRDAPIRIAPDVRRWAGQRGTVVEFNAGEVGVALVKGSPLVWFRPQELIKMPRWEG